MKVLGLDGRTHTWTLKDGAVDNPSSGHLRARAFLAKLFPVELRLEEVILPGSNNLRADFVIPQKRLLVEVHGRQHFERVGHFQPTTGHFWQGVYRDRRKREWAELNEWTYIALPDDASENEWADLILRPSE